MATRKPKCSQTGDLNLQEGAIFSRTLNDNRIMIVTGLCFIRFSSQNVCFKIVYSKKKHRPKPNRNLEKTNRNRTVSSEPRVTDISVNRGSPILVTSQQQYCSNAIPSSRYQGFPRWFSRFFAFALVTCWQVFFDMSGTSCWQPCKGNFTPGRCFIISNKCSILQDNKSIHKKGKLKLLIVITSLARVYIIFSPV